MSSIFSEMLDVWKAAGQPLVPWADMAFSLNARGMARYLRDAQQVPSPLRHVLTVKVLYAAEQLPDVQLQCRAN